MSNTPSRNPRSAEDDVESPWLPPAERPRKRKIKQDAILKAAINEFGRVGYTAARFESIAEALNVSKPTIHYYYRTKEDLLVACCKVAEGRIRREVSRLLKLHADPRERLKGVIENNLAILFSDVGRCLTKISPSELRQENRQHMEDIWQEFGELVRKLIEDGREKGVFHVDDPVIAAHTLVGAIKEAPNWCDPENDFEVDTCAAKIRDLLLRSLEPM